MATPETPPDNSAFLQKHAELIGQAKQAWKALVQGAEEKNISYTEHEERRRKYMELLRELKSRYVEDGLFMRDLHSDNCRDGLNGNFHLITEVITGEPSPPPSRFR